MKKPTVFGKRPALLVSPRNVLIIIYPVDGRMEYAIGEGKDLAWHRVVVSKATQKELIRTATDRCQYDFIGYL